MSRNTLNTLKDFNISDSKKGKLYSLPALEKSLGINVSR
ncbi:MAG: aconitate hydratase, partial [Pseudomonadota bacterium]